MNAQPFRKFDFVRVYDSDPIIKSTATIAKRRYMPKGKQITVYTRTGWPQDREKAFRCADMHQARLIIEDHFFGLPYKKA